jgi:hypothetical protein
VSGRRVRASDEVTRLRRKHVSLIVPVSDFAFGDRPVAEVSSFTALIELAKKYEAVVMELQTGASTTYLVWDNGMVYRYRAGRGEPAAVRRSPDSAGG